MLDPMLASCMRPRATPDGPTATGARPFFAPRAPGPHARRAAKKGLQQPPECPLLQPAMLEGRSTGGTAAASKEHRLPDLRGGAEMGVPRPLVHTRRGGLGGGWRLLCTHTEGGIDVLRGEQACARAKPPPPSSARGASQSTRKSTLRTGHGHSEGRGVKRCGGGCPDRFR